MAETTYGSLALAAAAHLAKSADTVQSLSGSPTEIRRQGEVLVEWAQLYRAVLPENYLVGLEKNQMQSSEHEVFYRTSDLRVIKRTHPGAYGFAVSSNGKHRAATPLLYLERLLLMNAAFDADMRLEGVLVDGVNTYDDGSPKPSIVISQNWIQAQDEQAPHPSEAEIKEFMESLGFSRLPDCITKWKKDRLIVSDAREHNFIKSVAGLIPIDLMINNLVDCD